MQVLKLTDLDLRGKRVFIRADFNVPQNDDGSIADDTRIRATVPGIRAARDAGAIGGKLLGAGGGGFMLLFVRPEHQARVRESLNTLVHVPFEFEESGSRVMLYQPNGLS